MQVPRLITTEKELNGQTCGPAPTTSPLTTLAILAPANLHQWPYIYEAGSRNNLHHLFKGYSGQGGQPK